MIALLSSANSTVVMFALSLNGTTRRRLLICSLVAVGLFTSGCDLFGSESGDSPTPDIQTKELPSLGAVPFDALGNGTIAFQRMHNLEADPPPGLYVIDGKRKEIRSHLGGTLMHHATVSPDGKEVAFQTLSPNQADSFWDVYVVRLDGTELRQISDFPENSEGAPTWTPDGSKVVFPNLPNEMAGPVEIYAQPPTSATSDRTLLHEVELEIDTSGFFGGTLAVSSDRKIAFVRGGNQADFGIEVLSPDSTAPTRLYEASSGTPIYEPAWSPDGRRLAFLEVTSEETRVRILELADQSVRTVGTTDAPASRLNVEGVTNFSLCWRGNGSTIVFSKPDGTSGSGLGSAHVYAVPAPGGDVVQVTSADGVIDYNVSCK